MARPTSIRILLTDGTPDGIRIVEKSNWTGRAVVGSRTQLADALTRDELSRPGVYVLAGTDDDGEQRLYVGEAADENLNKAHVRYLEARLVKLAKTANQWILENRNDHHHDRHDEARRSRTPPHVLTRPEPRNHSVRPFRPVVPSLPGALPPHVTWRLTVVSAGPTQNAMCRAVRCTPRHGWRSSQLGPCSAPPSTAATPISNSWTPTSVTGAPSP